MLQEETTCTGGSAIRRTTFGRACVYERLLCLDDMQHLLRWQIINGKSDSQNPFPASLVNYVTAIQLLPVSVGDQTYFAWSGKPDHCAAAKLSGAASMCNSGRFCQLSWNWKLCHHVTAIFRYSTVKRTVILLASKGVWPKE